MMNSNDAMHKAIALHQQALDLRSFLSMHEFHMHEQAIDADDEEEEDSSSPVHASYSSLELRRGIILFDPKDMEQHDDPFHVQLEDNQTHDQSTSSCYLDNQKTHDSDSHSEKTIDIRNKIIIEICSTERNYVRDIRILHDFYIVPLEEHKHPIMEDAQIAVFFNNLRQLVMLNSKLQNDLMTIILQRHLSLDGSESISSDSNTNSHTSSEGIGAVFCRYAPLFKLYGGYAKNYQEVAQFLTKCKQDKSFSDFLLTCESKSPSNKSFDSLLIMPIQRIPLYQLLLIRMCEYTSMDHPDYEFLHQAVARIESAASLINETIRDQENLSRVVEAQQQFAGQVSLITPTRRLLKKGMLIKISTRRSEAVMIHLFNDLLLYSGVLLTGGYRVRRVVQLNSKAVRIQNQVPSTYRTVCSINTHQNGFLITSLEKTFVLFASNLKEKNEWVDAIVDAIRIAQTSSPLKMESPADAAALWVPDAVAGACSVCLVSFKVYFRRHHCRRCGAVVCGNCSDHRSILFVTDSVKEERVCAPCFRVLSRVKRLALKWIDHMILFRGILRRKRSNQKWSEYYYELRAGVLKQYTLASANPANPKCWLESVSLAGAIVIHRSDERAAKNQFSFQISMGMEEEEEDPHVESEESEDEGRISPCTTHSPQDSHPPSPLSSTSRTMSSSRLRQKLVARFQSKRRTSSSTHSGLSSEGSMNGFQNRMDYGWILSATCYEEEKKWSLAIQQSADQALHKTRRSHVVDFNPGQDVESASEQPISDLNLTPSVVVSDGELQRIRIVYEIIRSEESYITCLEECIQLYIQPLLLRQLETQKMNNLRKIQSTPTLLSHAKKKKEKLNKHKILLDADMAIFFNSMDQLCTLNQQLLEHLSRHADEMKETCASYRPGAIFNAYAPLFQLYTAYASRYEGALKIITSLPFQTFVEQLPNQHTTVHRFKTFLNMPMERIPSYKIFLTELLQYTASDHMDYLPLQNAIASIHRVALKVEEIIKRREHMDRIEILSNKVGMDLTGKTFIQEGFLQKVCRSKVQNYYFLLMDDALIYGRMGTHLHKKKFRQIDLWECKIQGNTTSIPDVIPNATNAFSFFSPLKSFILLASSLEEKMKWIHSIQECIDKTLHTPTTTYRRPSIRSELLLDDTPFQESTSLWNSETAARLVIKNGWLNVVSEEKTKKMTTTRRLWITLTQQNITFASTFKGAQPEEIIDIESCQASSMTEETYFQLCTSCGPRVYLLETQSYTEREEWLRALNHCISNSTILGTNNTNVLEIRRRSLNTATLAPIFMFNKVSNVCTLCYHPFAVYRPRHHCRICGCLVCGNCSKRKWALSYSSSKKASRVCDHCADTACQSVSSTVLEM